MQDIFPQDLIDKTKSLILKYKKLGLRLGTAESCTGGLLGGLIVSIPGSSDIYSEGIISYSNEAKTKYLNVNPDLIAQHGAVSPEVAYAMANGLTKSDLIDIGISITGIAGPAKLPENEEPINYKTSKPIGLVYLNCINKKQSRIEEKKCLFSDIGRTNVRISTIETALEMLDKIVD